MPTIRIAEFDVWREGYASSIVSVLQAGTTSTLASIFTDEALTLPADNPQELLSRELNDRLYGKFSVPLYTSDAYELAIDSTDRTGVIRPPLTDLEGEDGSALTVQSVDGSEDVPLEDIVARTVYVTDFGEFLPTSDSGASSSTNNDTIESALGAVASGGFVVFPGGTFAFTSFELPALVCLVGQGKDVTILQSQTAAEVITLDGEGCGLQDITLDGVLLTGGSVGVYGKGLTRSKFTRAKVTRFGTGVYFQGHDGAVWTDFDVTGCTTNVKLHGDTDGDDGTSIINNQWQGRCAESVSLGLGLEYIDAILAHNAFDVAFEDNALTAVKIRGARYTDFEGSSWVDNATDLDVDDFVTGSFEDDNTVLGLWVRSFSMTGGAINMTGDLGDVVFERGLMADVDVTLTVPGNAVVARDVVEDADVTIAGDGTKWLRWTTTDHGASSGITTGNAATKAWSIELEPGQRCLLVGSVLGNAKTSDESAEYYIAVSARRPPSTLAYDTQTANFTTGLTVTGGTSGATALAVTDTDAGATGTLEIRDIVGTFIDNELLTDSSTGSALVNGSQSDVSAELLGAVTSLRTAREDDASWGAVFAANGPEIELQVTGNTSKTVEWVVNVDVTKT